MLSSYALARKKTKNVPRFIMNNSRNSFLLISLIILQVFGKVTFSCDHSERSISFLDVAVDMITKAKINLPTCPDKTLKPVDCDEVLQSGHNESGIYTIWPRSRVIDDKPIDVFCDMETDEGGWTEQVLKGHHIAPTNLTELRTALANIWYVIPVECVQKLVESMPLVRQPLSRRGNFNRPQDYFFKDWNSYKNGFGDAEEDFWLGNDNIFALTSQRLYSLRFDLQSVDGERRYALYDTFWIEDESTNYTLNVKEYSGDAGDSILGHHISQKFTTKDRDNDSQKDQNCALLYKGGWWYNSCHYSNPNGLYLRGVHESYADGVNWHSWKGYKESLETTEIKIRPTHFRKKAV
ncbi:techylectin-5A [Trichonephila clavipes]|nr:techylectin-5A [Trichonephila clavipes]